MQDCVTNIDCNEISSPADTGAFTIRAEGAHLMRLVLRTRPSPPQVVQGVVRSPVPMHSRQSCTCWNTPSGVRTAVATCPAPPQALQVVGLVPALAPLPLQVPHSVMRSTCPRPAPRTSAAPTHAMDDMQVFLASRRWEAGLGNTTRALQQVT